MTKQNRPKGIKSVNRVFDIIELLIDQDGATLTQIANELDLAKSTTHSYLHSLTSRGAIIKEGKKYKASLLFVRYGTNVQKSRNLLRAARPELLDLATDLDLPALLATEENGKKVLLENINGGEDFDLDHPEGDIGYPYHMHCNALGKAMLANFSEDQINDILDQEGLPKSTKATITDRQSLFSDLEKISDRGYAISKGEEIPGIKGVGVPIIPHNEVVGAISVNGPEYRITQENRNEKLADRLLSAASVIELRLITDQKQRE